MILAPPAGDAFNFGAIFFPTNIHVYTDVRSRRPGRLPHQCIRLIPRHWTIAHPSSPYTAQHSTFWVQGVERGRRLFHPLESVHGGCAVVSARDGGEGRGCEFLVCDVLRRGVGNVSSPLSCRVPKLIM